MKINDSNGLSSPWIYIFSFQSHREVKLCITLDVGERVMGSTPWFSTDLFELYESTSESFSVKNLNLPKIIERFSWKGTLKDI